MPIPRRWRASHGALISAGANTNRFLRTCIIDVSVSEATAFRAAELRRLARTGSAVDALVVVLAEPGGTVLTGDHADGVAVSVI
jgi:hypothetical protein